MNAHTGNDQYREGYESRKRGESVYENPYIQGTTNRMLWLEGFMDANQDEEAMEER